MFLNTCLFLRVESSFLVLWLLPIPSLFPFPPQRESTTEYSLMILQCIRFLNFSPNSHMLYFSTEGIFCDAPPNLSIFCVTVISWNVLKRCQDRILWWYLFKSLSLSHITLGYVFSFWGPYHLADFQIASNFLKVLFSSCLVILRRKP